MHKIKKGIKKKIKGKKDKDNSELFTPEEYERYKKQKEEEERLKQEQLQQQTLPQEVVAEEDQVVEEVTENHEESVVEEQAPQKADENSDTKEDWRSFFSATDTVLKKTSVNLEHIKESSYFQVKKAEEVLEERNSKTASPVPPPVPPPPTKRWVDLDKEGIDDNSEEGEDQQQDKEEGKSDDKDFKANAFEPPKDIVLKPIEDIPLISEEDYADVFDTTYVDAVEGGEIQLYQIPDSPTLENLNEPDPFDTSDVDKVLKIEKEPVKEQSLIKPEEPQKKKKKNLVNLGCAVDVLTGKVPESSKKKSKEINLLADFEDQEENLDKEKLGESKEEQEDLTESNKKVDEETKESEEKCALDDLLFGDSEVDLPKVAVPTQLPFESDKEREKDIKVIEEDLTELLDPLAAVNNLDSDRKESHLQDLVSEFDVISEVKTSSATSAAPVLPPVLTTKTIGIDDNIKDEFDAEFAVLAAESIAKEKEKAIDEIGVLDEDDPFDTTSVSKVLGQEGETLTENTERGIQTKDGAKLLEEKEEDPFNVDFAEEYIKENKSHKPPRPTPPKSTPFSAFEEEDPFDTSVAASVLPADPFEAVEDSISLPETLKPQLDIEDQNNTDSFDPFDTSVADSFGKTELKVLEGELLGDIHKQPIEDLDFDFNPREEEEKQELKAKSTPPIRPPSPACLLTTTEETPEGPVLIPQTANEVSEDFDPFDTSIAEKVHIKSLEEELLTEFHSESKKQPPPRPVSPSCFISSLNTESESLAKISSIAKKALAEDFDPFDTSIADHIESSDCDTKVEKETLPENLKLNLKPPRPASPICLLAATPTDENPILAPILEPCSNSKENKEEEFDPFDTSIAEQFGQTELKVLETELLKSTHTDIQEDDHFDPRAEEAKPSRPPPPPRPVSPACLLTSTVEVEQNLPPLSPITASKFPQVEEEVDPFDTSIADKFGKTEILHLESELLNDIGGIKETHLSQIEVAANAPLRPPPATCVFATTPTDTNPPLQPFSKDPQPVEETTVGEIDPFDTSIADKFGKTELKALEETLLSENKEKEIKSELNISVNDHLFDISPSAEKLPILKPSSNSVEQVFNKSSIPAEEPDPFDTSIAAKFGQVELKVLESELLVDSSVKRNLSDDEFNPREEEEDTTDPKTTSNNQNSVNILDFDIDHSETSAPVLQANPVRNEIEETELEIDPFDTSIAENIVPGKQELRLLDKELLGSD